MSSVRLLCIYMVMNLCIDKAKSGMNRKKGEVTVILIVNVNGFEITWETFEGFSVRVLSGWFKRKEDLECGQYHSLGWGTGLKK